MIGAAVVSAQDATQTPPAEIGAAIADLSGRVGTTLTADTLDSFTWSAQTFADTSLGCPQPDTAYAQIQTGGFQFLLVYQGQTYDYRVTTGGGAVILCSSGAATETTPGATVDVSPEATITAAPPTTAPEATTAPTLAPTAVVAPCTSGLTPRLTVGQLARTSTGVNSNVRATPDANGQVMGAVGAGVTFNVLEGPVCGPEGFNWWRVEQGPLTGWVAEGQNGLYYLEPVPQPLPAADALNLVTGANASGLTQISRLDGNLSGVIAWSPDGATLAVAGSNTVNPAIWLYAAGALDTQQPRQLSVNAIPTALVFTADGATLVVGTADSRVTFYDVNSGAAGYSFATDTGAVRDLRFSPDGHVLAVIGEATSMTFWGVPVAPGSTAQVIPPLTEEATGETTESATAEATIGALPVDMTPTAQG
jgi:hypothetical protein